jgi:hypothetical protein
MLTQVMLEQPENTLTLDKDHPSTFVSVIPALEEFEQIDDFKSPVRRGLLKTHDLPSSYPLDTLYLVRRPEDSLVSHFHYARGKGLKVPAAVDEFCLYELPNWRAHAEDAITVAESSKKRLVCLSYEALHDRPLHALYCACSFLELSVSCDSLKRVVESQNLSQLKQLLPRDRWAKHNLRRGQVGGGAGELKLRTLKTIRAAADPLYERLAARAMRDIEEAVAAARRTTSRISRWTQRIRAWGKG